MDVPKRFSRAALLCLEEGAWWSNPHRSEDWLEYVDPQELKGWSAGMFKSFAVGRGWPGEKPE